MRTQMFIKDSFISNSYYEVLRVVGENDLEITSATFDVFALCAARHSMPFSMPSIFPQSVNPMDFGSLEETAEKALSACDSSIPVAIYVTGLTAALIAALNVCRQLGRNVVLMHYNREDQRYYPQWVL